MKTASHIDESDVANLRLVSGIGLVDLSRPELPERLAHLDRMGVPEGSGRKHDRAPFEHERGRAARR